MTQQQNHRTIFMSGMVNYRLADAFRDCLQGAVARGDRQLTVAVDSLGGEVEKALEMHDAIKAARSRGVSVDVVASGTQGTIGALLMAAGSKRTMTEDGRMLVQIFNVEAAALPGGGEETVMRARHILAAYGYPQDAAQNEAGLTAQEAQKAGLVDEIKRSGPSL
jgi:ATP-dependent protease ClpP protease subunit